MRSTSFPRSAALVVLLAASFLPACAAEGRSDPATEADELNSTCGEAHVASLRVSKVSDEMEDVEVCRQGSSALTPDVVKALRDIKEINDKAAALFHVDPKQLFGTGIRLRLIASEMGLDGSFETHDDDDRPLVTVETYDKPQNLLNRGAYAHELGHWLLWVPRDKMPMVLRSLGQSHFWGEAIADTIALAIEGTVTSPEPGVPACLERRTPTDLANRSYGGPNGFFLNRFQRSQSFACCESIANKPEFSKGTAACDAQLELEQQHAFDPTIPFDDTPFPVTEAAAKLREYSRYQLGTPVNSFLLEARDAIDPSILTRFLDAAKKVKPIAYACTMGTFTDVGKTRVTTASVREQLALVRQGLSPEQQAKFDAIAAKHGLEALDVLEPAELDERARGLAMNLLLVDGAPGEGKPLPTDHDCVFALQFAQVSSTGENPSPRCAVTCTRVP
jgi:hypothetical protein